MGFAFCYVAKYNTQAQGTLKREYSARKVNNVRAIPMRSLIK